MQRVGFARSPGTVASVMAEVADAAVAGATELVSLVRRRSSLDAVAERLASGRRVVLYDLAAAVGDSYSGALERGDFLKLVRSLDLFLRQLNRAAVATESGGPPLERWDELASILRDMARELRGALLSLDGPDQRRDRHLERVRLLRDEGRRLARARRVAAVNGGRDASAVIDYLQMLDAYERALIAGRDAAAVTARIVAKHA